jgi:hypothetical protein
MLGKNVIIPLLRADGNSIARFNDPDKSALSPRSYLSRD